MNIIQAKFLKENNVNNEIKNLKMDNNRKENIIKELKNNLEMYKNKEKKKDEEKGNIFDKIKKSKHITKFSVEDPTLNEIFLSKVGEAYEK